VTGHRSLRRSADLLAAFRREASDPDLFYGLLARDAVAIVAEQTSLGGSLVLDVGGGAGYFTAALRQAGARCVVVEPDIGELSWRGAPPDGAVVADGRRLPFADGVADLVVSSNVLEHAERPYALCADMIRATRRGGLIWISFTNWFSPWGGHETSPWHLAGGRYALRRFTQRNGHPPKNRYGENLFAVHVGSTLAWVRSRRDVEILDAGPRYHPSWARGVVRVPGLRELATWNLELLLRRR
jgi:SAM-dependent methyltransferase